MKHVPGGNPKNKGFDSYYVFLIMNSSSETLCLLQM